MLYATLCELTGDLCATRRLIDLKLEVTHEELVAQGHPVWRSLLSWREAIDALPFRVALVLVLFTIVFYGTQKDPYGEYNQVTCQVLVALLAIVLLAATVLTGTFWFVVIAPMELFPNYHVVLASGDHTDKNDLRGIVVKAEQRELMSIDGEDSGLGVKELMLKRCLTSWRAYACVINVLLALLVVINSVTPDPGDAFGEDLTFLVGFLLLEYMRLPSGVHFFASIKHGGKGLLDSAKVGVVVILLYSTAVNYLMYRDDVTDSTTDTCTTAYQCAFQTFNDGVRGDLTTLSQFRWTTQKFEDYSESQSHWWFLTVFTVFWLYLLRGVILGQIVDAFNAIRQHDDIRRADMSQFCIVCSSERVELEQIRPGAFEHHISTEHNPISYLYYLMHADEHLYDPLRSGLMAYVKREVTVDSFQWLPIGTCELLQSHEELQKSCAQPDPHTARVDALEVHINDRLDKMSEQIERLCRSFIAQDKGVAESTGEAAEAAQHEDE